MRPRERAQVRGIVALVLAVATLGACGDDAAPKAVVDAGPETGAPDAGVIDDPDPVFSDADRAALAALLRDDAAPLPADPTNAFADHAAAAELGRRFFFDPAFAGVLLDGDNDGSPNTLGRRGDTGKVSCAGCHLPEFSFADGRSLHKQLSLASRWSHRRTPSLLDVGEAGLVLWDGRKDSLFSQVFAPLEANEEMNSSRLFVAERIFATYRADYEAIFGALPPLDDAGRFPPLGAETTGCRRLVTSSGGDSYSDCHGRPGDGAEYDHMAAADQTAVTRVVVNFGKAIGAYERRLRCGAGPFDAWLRGDTSALSRAAARGAQLFVSRADCVRCHGGPSLSDQGFHNVGVKPVANDPTFARFLVLDDRGVASGVAQLALDPLRSTGEFSDGTDARHQLDPGRAPLGAIRTPSLRCVSTRPSFLHSGHLGTLESVVAFFRRGGDTYGYPGTNELHPLDLTAREEADLVAFLRALDGPGPPDALRH